MMRRFWKLRNGEDQQFGMGDAGRIQDAGGGGIAVDGRQAVLAQFLDASPDSRRLR
jgi:hypothetical protein